jgi:hypothetical protein
MVYVALECPRCGANIPPGAGATVVCAYCSATLVQTKSGFRVTDAFADEALESPHLPRFWLKGARYRVDGRIARGESAEVLLARRDHRVGERVIAKVLRASTDRDRLESEWSTIEALLASRARGGPHFTRLMPQPVANGEARFGTKGEQGERFATLYRFESGFVHDFVAVQEAYPQGIPATAAVWMYKRILETLVFIHESGFVHGAILPRHLLVHSRDHGVRMCGFTCAGRAGEALVARVATDLAFYPDAVATLTPSLDIAMSARCVLWLLAGDLAKTPEEITTVVSDAAAGRGAETALAVLDRLDAAALALFGPPRYVPFSMPGWPAQ